MLIIIYFTLFDTLGHHLNVYYITSQIETHKRLHIPLYVINIYIVQVYHNINIKMKTAIYIKCNLLIQ